VLPRVHRHSGGVRVRESKIAPVVPRAVQGRRDGRVQDARGRGDGHEGVLHRPRGRAPVRRHGRRGHGERERLCSAVSGAFCSTNVFHPPLGFNI
jgi:hypothetical protein